MKLLTSFNINSDFTYKEICIYLYKFWTKNVNIFYRRKIWLTISVTNNNNTSFTLIKNLPFNTFDYNDVLIVLRQKFNDEMLDNKKDKLVNITFSYYFDSNFKINCFSINTLLNLYFIFFLLFYIIILFSILFYYYKIDLYYSNDMILYNVSNINEISNFSYEKYIDHNTNINIFSKFTNLFKGDSSIKYFPSHFVNSNLNYYDRNYSLSEFIYLNHFIIIDRIDINQCFKEIKNVEFLNELSGIYHDYNKISIMNNLLLK